LEVWDQLAGRVFGRCEEREQLVVSIGVGVPCGERIEAHDATVREVAGDGNTTVRVASEDAQCPCTMTWSGRSSAGGHALQDRYQYGC
jgi:hypothetical protein